MTVSLFDATVRLVVAAVLSGIVGIEREVARKAAGLRTHMLVGLGSAVFALLSITGFDATDTSRIAAQVVTGVGFLGAGAIFREGASVRGLTTAAGLWAVAAVGLAAGAGRLALAAASVLVALAVLYGLRTIDAAMERRFRGRRTTVEVAMSEAARFLEVWNLATRVDSDVEHVLFERTQTGGLARFELAPKKTGLFIDLARAVEGVESVEEVR